MKRIHKTAARVIVALFFTVLMQGCGRQERPGGDVYSVRAVIAGLRDDGDSRILSLLHEAIPEFRNRNGEVTGMQAMMMNFSVARNVSTENVSPGDKVKVHFRVDWRGSSPVEIIALQGLDPQTELDLGGYTFE